MTVEALSGEITETKKKFMSSATKAGEQATGKKQEAEQADTNNQEIVTDSTKPTNINIYVE